MLSKKKENKKQVHTHTDAPTRIGTTTLSYLSHSLVVECDAARAGEGARAKADLGTAVMRALFTVLAVRGCRSSDDKGAGATAHVSLGRGLPLPHAKPFRHLDTHTHTRVKKKEETTCETHISALPRDTCTGNRMSTTTCAATAPGGSGVSKGANRGKK